MSWQRTDWRDMAVVALMLGTGPLAVLVTIVALWIYDKMTRREMIR